jgi:serralysin
MPVTSAISPRLNNAMWDVSSDPWPPESTNPVDYQIWLGTDLGDLIVGSPGDETIMGKGGNDTLKGGQGKDILVGGAGADTLYGGADNDTFWFNSVWDSRPDYLTWDTIMDFEAGDKINVSSIDAVTRLYGDQAFKLVNDFTGHAGELMWKAATPTVFTVSADVDGDSAADFFVQVNHAVSLTSLHASNFIL